MPAIAIAAPIIAAAGLLFAGLGALGAHYRWFSPIAGFLLCAALGLLLCGVLAAVLGAVGVVKTRPSTGLAGAPLAWIGLVVGLSFLATVYSLTPPEGVLPIHDLTTDPDDPPQFQAALRESGNAERDLTYPNGPDDTAERQRSAYPDLRPIYIELDPDPAFARCIDAADQLGWRVIAVDHEARTFEAVDETTIFRFADDIVLRIRDEGRRSRIDLRSTSRVGQSDLGANAARIRRFRTQIVDGETRPE